MILQIDEGRYLIQLKRKYTLSDILKTGNIARCSHASNFVEKIYISFISNPEGSSDEYYKYYKKEYSSLQDFFFWRYGVPKEVFQKLNLRKIGVIGIINFPWYQDEDDIFLNSLRDLFTKVDK